MDEVIITIVNDEQFVCFEGRTLKAALKLAGAIVSHRTNIPVLSHVLLRVGDEGSYIRATDLDNDLQIGVNEIASSGEWAICIPLHLLATIAGAAGAADITITRTRFERTWKVRGEQKSHTHEGCRVTIGADDAVYDLPYCIASEEFPDRHKPDLTEIEEFSNGQFPAMIAKVSWCMSLAETRYYLNGVCWRRGKDGARLIATDGHRLAQYRFSSEDQDEASFIIHSATAFFIQNHLKGMDLRILANSKAATPMMEIRAHGISLLSKLVDGNFPDTDRVTPADDLAKFKFRFQKPELLSSIEKASAIAGRISFDGNALTFRPKDGRTQIALRNMDAGTSEVTTSQSWPVGAEPFGFNRHYIFEMVKRCAGEISVQMTGNRDPFVIKDEDPAMTRVLMPMRA